MKKKKAKFKSYSIQNVMMVTCMQKRVNIKLNPERQDGHLHTEDVEDQIPPERHGGHLQAEEGENKVQLITEHIVITCMQKKVKIMFNSIQNAREITCMHQRVNIKSNSMQEAMVVTCMQMEGQRGKLGLHTALSLFLALIAWLASMKLVLQSIFMSTRCVHRSHFQSGFLN